MRSNSSFPLADDIKNKTSAFTQYLQHSGPYIVSIGILSFMCLGLFLRNIRLLRSVRRLSMRKNTSSGAGAYAQTKHPVASVISAPTAQVTPVLPSSNQGEAVKFIDTFPKHPLAVRGIRLYVLWQPSFPQPSGQLPFPSSFLCRTLPLGPWSATDILQRPAPGGEEEPWLPAQEALDIIARLLKEISSLVVNAPAQSVYILVNVREFSTTRPRYSWRIRKEDIEQEVVGRQKRFMECLQELAGLHVKTTFRDPQAFEHYDRMARRHGWLTVTPRWAVLCGVGNAEARQLANIIQPQDLSVEHGGIDDQRYDGVLGRVVQWNSTQDFFEAVNRLEALAKGGEISTRGQLWLNFSLAFIGILLSIVGIGTFGWSLVAALLLFALASLLFAWYASKGIVFLLPLGVLCFLAAIAVALVFAPQWFPLLQPHSQK